MSVPAPAKMSARERLEMLSAVAIVVATTLTTILGPLLLG